MRRSSVYPGWGPPPSAPTRPNRINALGMLVGAFVGAFVIVWVLSHWGLIAIGLIALLGYAVKQSPRRGVTVLAVLAAVLLFGIVTGTGPPTEVTAAPEVSQAIKDKAPVDAPGELEEVRQKVADLYGQLATLFTSPPDKETP